jgi:hypothetical protein
LVPRVPLHDFFLQKKNQRFGPLSFSQH